MDKYTTTPSRPIAGADRQLEGSGLTSFCLNPYRLRKMNTLRQMGDNEL